MHEEFFSTKKNLFSIIGHTTLLEVEIITLVIYIEILLRFQHTYTRYLFSFFRPSSQWVEGNQYSAESQTSEHCRASRGGGREKFRKVTLEIKWWLYKGLFSPLFQLTCAFLIAPSSVCLKTFHIFVFFSSNTGSISEKSNVTKVHSCFLMLTFI